MVVRGPSTIHYTVLKFFVSRSRLRVFHPTAQTFLQSINKLRILAISQIQPFLVLQLPIMRLCAEGGLRLVLSLAVPPDENHVDETGTPAADDGNLGRLVARRVFGSEGLRSCSFPRFIVS